MIDLLTLTAGNVRATVDLASGGRLSALQIGEAQLLAERTDDPLTWGCYPMVPFAGRIRHGRFSFAGVDHQLPASLGGHAIHGYGFTSEWTAVDATTIEWAFTEPWPFTGRARQTFELTDTSLTITLDVMAHDTQPVHVGWHPWFLRETAAGTLQFDLPESSMYRRDADGMPDGTLIHPPPGPWDDCFTNLQSDPVLRWGELTLRLSSDASHWVVYDQPDHVLCVEPQTGPPNEINTAPQVLDAGQTHTTRFTMDWDPKPPAGTA